MLIQEYFMRDHRGHVYDNETLIFKKSMRQFGPLLLDDNRLFKEVLINSRIQLPDDLKSLTPSCTFSDTQNKIQVLHRLQIQLQFKRYDGDNSTPPQWRNLEIRANIPLLLYVSPSVSMRGRKIHYDKVTGRIHFRPGETIPLFDNILPSPLPPSMESDYHYEDDNIQQPPPKYEEHGKDPIVIPHNIPSYEQATS